MQAHLLSCIPIAYSSTPYQLFFFCIILKNFDFPHLIFLWCLFPTSSSKYCMIYLFKCSCGWFILLYLWCHITCTCQNSDHVKNSEGHKNFVLKKSDYLCSYLRLIIIWRNIQTFVGLSLFNHQMIILIIRVDSS